MYRMKENLESVAVVSALLVCAPLVGARQERRAGTDVAVHAKGIAVLSLSFASRGEVSGVSLFVSRDGQTYQDSQAGLLRGSPLFTSTADDGRTTSVLVSLVGRFPYGTYSFLFAEPGTYYLRWGVGFEDNPDAGLKIHQTIEVEPARRCDLDFLADPVRQADMGEATVPADILVIVHGRRQRSLGHMLVDGFGLPDKGLGEFIVQVHPDFLELPSRLVFEQEKPLVLVIHEQVEGELRRVFSHV